MKKEVDWLPQDRQLVALKACGLDFPFTGAPLRPAIADVIGYGGAAGGGKTDTLLIIALIAALMFPRINIGYFRREFPQLEGPGGAIIRSFEIFSGIARYNQQKKRWTFPNGSIIQFCHCSDPKDVYNYQSQQFDILLIDEATQFTEEIVDYLITRNRKTIDDPRFTPFCAMGTNPGNIGNKFFYDRFINIGDPEVVHIYTYPTKVTRTHFFIPSHLSDNQILVMRDPTYETRLSTNELNRRMLLLGEWITGQGQAFSELRLDMHMIDPYELPKDESYFGAYDHGFKHPFSFGVFKVDQDGGVTMVRYVSDRLKRVDQIAEMMKQVFPIERLAYIVAGTDCWSVMKDGGPTISEKFGKYTDPETNKSWSKKITFIRAKTDRVQGASQVRDFLAWQDVIVNEDGTTENGEPRFHIFKPYGAVYDTLARMLFDPIKPEAVAKQNANEEGKNGDDDYDMVRYALMSRPRPMYQKKSEFPIDSGMALLEEHLKRKKMMRQMGLE